MISNIQNTQNVSTIKTTISSDLKSNGTTNATATQNIDTFEKTGDVGENITYNPPKKLTEEQIEALQRQQTESTLSWYRDMVQQNVATQAGQTSVLHNGIELSANSANLLSDIFGSLEAALPTPATTPEGALADISPGGAYSIEAVSDRIMLMATTLSGGDPEVMAEMEQAVKKGFEAAGLNLETGEGMPDITMDTYNHIMNEFAELKGTTAEDESV